MTRIGIVSNTSWNIYNFRMPLLKSLKHKGYAPVVIAPTDNFSDKIKEAGFEFIPLKNLARKGSNPIRDIALYKEFLSHFKAQQLDVVLLYTIKPNIYGVMAAKKLKVKSISTITGLGFAFMSKGLASRFAKLLYKMALKHADSLFFQNSDDQKLFEGLGIIQAGGSRIINGSGIDLNRFEFKPKEFEPKKVLMVGRLLKDKGVFEFVEAAITLKSKYPHVNFEVLGGLDKGNPTAVREEEVDGWRKEGITFHGNVEDVKTYIENCDIIVLPSYREGLPRAILEGMAIGRICIGFNVPGVSSLIEHEISGFLVNKIGGKYLAEGIETVLTYEKRKAKNIIYFARKKTEELYSSVFICNVYLDEIQNFLSLKSSKD